MDDTTLTAEREEGLKSLWVKVKEESERASVLKNKQTNKNQTKPKQKNPKIMASHSITSWQKRGKGGGSDRFPLLGL